VSFPTALEPVAPKIHYQWKDFDSDIDVLYSRFQPRNLLPEVTSNSVIVGIERGGVVPAVTLSHKLGIRLEFVKWSNGKYGSQAVYDGEKWYRLMRSLSPNGVLYLVDDICDSGRTFASLLEIATSLMGGHFADRIVTLCLWSNVSCEFQVSDFVNSIDRATDNRFIVFPWER